MPYTPITTENPFRLRTICLALAVAVLLLVLVGYIAYQARFLLTGPQIVAADTAITTVNERTVTIAGEARNIARIALNGQQIYTNPEGAFAEQVVLTEGYNLLTIAATDRYGRTSEVVREYVYKPDAMIQ